MAGKMQLAGNPIIITTAETWITHDMCLAADQILWINCTADGLTLVLAKNDTSAKASNMATRYGKEGVDISIFPQPMVFSSLYLRTLESGHIEIYRS